MVVMRRTSPAKMVTSAPNCFFALSTYSSREKLLPAESTPTTAPEASVLRSATTGEPITVVERRNRLGIWLCIVSDIADASIVPELLSRLEGKDPIARTHIINILARFNRRDVGVALQRQLKDTNKFVRQAVLNALANFEGAVDVGLLCEVLRDPDVETQQKAIDAVAGGQVRFVPEQWVNTYNQWMNNIQDWCISRQLWWGHQIPAWYGPDGKVFVALDEASAEAQAKAHYAAFPLSPSLRGEGRGEGRQHVPSEQAAAPHPSPLPARGQGAGRGDEIVLTRDPDVLDTWFSSALWPFSTLGWPENTKEVQRFYPTSCLVTGFDIIFFWVARMMMSGLHFMKEVPFKDVYIHALVRDEQGRKFSKSKGIGIDPLDDARALVPEDDREQAFRVTAGAGEFVRVADARGLDLDQDLIAADRGLRHIPEFQEAFALLGLDQCQHVTLLRQSRSIPAR